MEPLWHDIQASADILGATIFRRLLLLCASISSLVFHCSLTQAIFGNPNSIADKLSILSKHYLILELSCPPDYVSCAVQTLQYRLEILSQAGQTFYPCRLLTQCVHSYVICLHLPNWSSSMVSCGRCHSDFWTIPACQLQEAHLCCGRRKVSLP